MHIVDVLLILMVAPILEEPWLIPQHTAPILIAFPALGVPHICQQVQQQLFIELAFEFVALDGVEEDILDFVDIAKFVLIEHFEYFLDNGVVLVFLDAGR